MTSLLCSEATERPAFGEQEELVLNQFVRDAAARISLDPARNLVIRVPGQSLSTYQGICVDLREISRSGFARLPSLEEFANQTELKQSFVHGFLGKAISGPKHISETGGLGESSAKCPWVSRGSSIFATFALRDETAAGMVSFLRKSSGQ